jgi:hypothetical protein
MIQKRKPKRKTIYHIKRGATDAVSHFLSAFSIFIILLFLTGFFILFQWKNVMFRSVLAQIDRLSEEILVLNTEKARLETIRNELLKTVPEKAEKKLGLITSVQAGQQLTVDKRQLAHYEEKDKQIP